MLNILISPKKNLSLLVSFFLNFVKKFRLRVLISDFNDLTLPIRVELCRLIKASYLIKKKEINSHYIYSYKLQNKFINLTI